MERNLLCWRPEVWRYVGYSAPEGRPGSPRKIGTDLPFGSVPDFPSPALLATTGGCGTHEPVTRLESPSLRIHHRREYLHSGSTVLAEFPAASALLRGSHENQGQ